MSNVLHFHYDFIPHEILDPATSAHRIALMQSAGVETVWLDTYATCLPRARKRWRQKSFWNATAFACRR